MLLDFIIVLLYFVAVFLLAMRGRQGIHVTKEEYFLSNRDLRWHSVAISTIATNIQGYQFLGMMGSAYLYGLAQAQLEINAVQGIFMAAFIFVPLYLKDKVITITQFIKKRLGKTVGLLYSASNIFLFATVGLGAALFWGAYAAEMVFGEYFVFINQGFNAIFGESHSINPQFIRAGAILVALGVFSAIYTYMGGLAAVVKTDIIQFGILFTGGVVITIVAVNQLGGWGELYRNATTRELMHLHLPADHPKLPWPFMFGLFLLNINYWCANQAVVQRSLAARSLKDAQVGLMVGGLMKYFMAIIIIVPGIALAGILADNPLSDPDMTFPHLVSTYLGPGIRGIILCALFASLMSTVDSSFNSLAALFSMDIYKEYINKEATDSQIVQVGRRTILVALCTGVTMGLILLAVKLGDGQSAFTHTLNEIRYYVNCGLVVVICSAAFLLTPKRWLAAVAFLSTVVLQFTFVHTFPEMNYFIRAGWVILIGFLLVALPTVFGLREKTEPPTKGGFIPLQKIFSFANRQVMWAGLGLLFSLVLLHLLFH
jgi:SSS family solute:Na+ symporter